MYLFTQTASRCWNKGLTISVNTLFKIHSRKYLSVPKDIVIYSRNSSHGITRIIGMCALGQWFAVGYMSSVMYQNMPAFFRWIPTEEPSLSTSSSGYQRLPLADWKYRLGFSLFSFGAASAFMATMFIYCLRSVSSITLLKASDQVMFTTYTPLGTFRSFMVSVRNVSALQPRSGIMSQIPLKVKDHKFHYMIETSGQFPHPTLFDRTVGIKRDFGLEKKT